MNSDEKPEKSSAIKKKKIKKFNVEKQTKINNDFEKVVDSMKANIAY